MNYLDKRVEEINRELRVKNIDEGFLKLKGVEEKQTNKNDIAANK